MTVVVMSRDRREELLVSLGRHRAPVVLVDNGSTDGTAAAVRARHPHVEVVELGRNVGAAARTIGVRRARTPYVAFADDDSWWAPGSLRTAAQALEEHPDVAVVGARILVGPTERPDPIDEVMAGSPLRGRPGLPGPRVLGFVGCAAMVRADAFLEVGGFDDVVRFPGEEERVALDLTARGHALVHLDAAVVHHHPSPIRHAPAARVRAIGRSAVLTAAMRLPARRALGTAAALARSGPAGRAAVLAALPRLPRALRRRAVVPQHVLDDLDLLRAEPAPLPATSPSGGPA